MSEYATEKYTLPKYEECSTTPVTHRLLGCLVNRTNCVHAINEEKRLLCLHPNGLGFLKKARHTRKRP